MTGTRVAATLTSIPAAWNGERTEYPDQCIHALFTAQVEHTPNAIALEFGEAKIKYGALNKMADNVAAVLAGFELAPGTRVAISQDRSPEFIAALLGVLKAGGVYVPIESRDPDERLRFLLNDAAVRFVLGSPDQRPRIERLQVSAAFIDLFDLPQATGEPGRAAAVSPTAPAYIMYTSGSTGAPKGVIVSHRSVVRLVRNTNYIQIAPRDVFLQLAPAAFDASTLEIFGPLLNGARLAIAPAGPVSLADIDSLIEEHRVSILWLTSGLFHALVDERPKALRNLRQLLAGGDVLSADHVRRAVAAMKNGCVINGYGPTENTTFTCCYRVTRDTEIGDSVPIGTPVSNTSVYILDANLRPVGIGEVGEIFIGGDGLALGYLNRPELEREKFVANPLGSEDGDGRLYRSGDLGRFTRSGAIEFCGRVDEQIKVRGYRVEPGEIEKAAAGFPGIAQAMVVAVQDQAGDKSLACHYSALPGAAVDPQQLGAYLAGLLPAPMVPSKYRQWDTFPLTPNGKVDRNLLRAGVPAAPAVPASPDSVATIHDTIVEMFRTVLGRDDVSLDDDFFDLGGHSLGAVRLFARIEERFSRRLPLATMFEATTPRQLAAILGDKEGVNGWSPLVAIRATGTRAPVFLVHAIGGNVLSYINLHALLPPEQPIYAFQAVALKEGHMARTTIEEVAAGYIADLRSIQPQGPYYIGGFSSGGIVAYEMAQQLTRVGQKVATTLLMDSYVEPSASALLRSLRFQRAVARMVGTVLWNLSFVQRTGFRSFVQKKFHNLFLNLRIGFYQFRCAASGLFQSRPPHRFLTIEEAFIIALENYVPEPYDGFAVLLRTQDSISYDSGNSGLWKQLVKHLDIVDVPGDHDSMFQQPFVKVLATTIANYLDGGPAKK